MFVNLALLKIDSSLIEYIVNSFPSLHFSELLPNSPLPQSHSPSIFSSEKSRTPRDDSQTNWGPDTCPFNMGTSTVPNAWLACIKYFLFLIENILSRELREHIKYINDIHNQSTNK